MKREYVIVKTTNENRGSDSVMEVYGPYENGLDAERECATMKDETPKAMKDRYDFVVMVMI